MTKQPKLTDLDLVILSAASARKAGNIFPIPKSIANKTEEVATCLDKLMAAKRAAPVFVTRLEHMWREEPQGRIGLKITSKGMAVIDDGDCSLQENADDAVDSHVEQTQSASTNTDGNATLREGSKQLMLHDLLAHDNGATLDEIVAQMQMLPHSARAAITGLRKKGFDITNQRQDGVSRYQLHSGAA